MPTGSVSLANLRLSLVSTAPFVDFSAAGTLTPYRNWRLVLTDSAGKTAKARIVSAGTGETLGSEIITSWTNVAMETLTVSGTDITEATNSVSTGSAIVAAPIVGAGGLYKFVLGAYTLVSGADPAFRITNQSNAGSGGTDELVLAPPSASTSYRSLNGTRYAGYRFLASGSITASGHSLKQVLTPSATGVVTSTWTIESGFNYNDAGGYTYSISPVGRSIAAQMSIRRRRRLHG